jgi:hypothetical protein
VSFMPGAEKLCDLSAPSGNEATAPGGIETRLVPRSPRVVSIGQAPTIDGCRFGSRGLSRRTPRSLNSMASPRPTQRRRTASFLCSLTTADRVPRLTPFSTQARRRQARRERRREGQG